MSMNFEKTDVFIKEITDNIQSKLLNYFKSNDNSRTNALLMQLPLFVDLNRELKMQKITNQLLVKERKKML